jgi:LacI family transcriptional regulator
MSSVPKRVSMMDIAHHLNISQATVSYVLSGRTGGSIGKDTRERVLEAAQQMGYRRNRAAQALAGHRSHLIEFCVWGLNPAFCSQALDAFDRQLRDTPYESLIVNLSSIGEEDWTSSTGIWPVDGIILHHPLTKKALASVQRRQTPLVSTGAEPNKEVDHVYVDMAPAMLQAIRHLTAHNRRVAYVSPDHQENWALNIDARYGSYRRVMREAGLVEEKILTPEEQGVTNRASVRRAIRDAILAKGHPGGLFCFNDEVAVAALAALRDLGLRVPQDVMLIGCDGIEETEYHSPAISTIQYPFLGVAQAAWKLLQSRMENPNLPLQSVILTANLVLRESSAR